MKAWPKDYHCAERTLDIELPWGGLTARVWFDGNSTNWTEGRMTALAKSVRSTEEFRHAEPEKLLNWLAKLTDVNAVQVFRSGPGYKIGVMAYLVPFEDRQPVTLAVNLDHE